MRKLVAKNDIILILVLLFCAFFIWLAFSLRTSENVIAVVEKSGETVREINLSALTEEISFEVEGCDGIKLKIKAENGKICFENALCDDLICVRTGYISKDGQTAVCLPAKVSIYIKGGEKTIDAVTQ